MFTSNLRFIGVVISIKTKYFKEIRNHWDLTQFYYIKLFSNGIERK